MHPSEHFDEERKKKDIGECYILPVLSKFFMKERSNSNHYSSSEIRTASGVLESELLPFMHCPRAAVPFLHLTLFLPLL